MMLAKQFCGPAIQLLQPMNMHGDTNMENICNKDVDWARMC